MFHKLGNSSDAFVKSLEGNDQGDCLLRSRDDLQGQLCDDAECSLGTDHQVEQGISRAGLGNGSAELDDLACRENNGHRAHVISCASIFDSAHTAGVGGNVAAEGCELLARIRGIQKASAKSVLCQIVKKNTGLYADNEIVLIVLKDLVHLLHVDHDAAVDGDRRSCQAGTGTARDYRDIVLIADLDDCRNIFCVGCVYNYFRGI